MTDFKKKYLKYKEKYLREKLLKRTNLVGGSEKKITYSKEILDFVNRTITSGNIISINNLKEAIYSCIYMNMTDMKGACEPTARTVKCSVVTSVNFPFLTSSGFDYANCKFIDDELNNNLVIIFGPGSVLYCDHFIKQVYIVFINIYEKLQAQLAKKSAYKFIHIVGHSMGASLSILFSYFIMIIEKSTVDRMHIPSLDYFSINYDLKHVYDFTDGGEYLCPDYLSEISPELVVTYDRDSNFEVIRQKTNELLAKGYPKIGNKISICSVGAFPVLFRAEDQAQFDEYLSFYENRYVIFGNCNNGAKPIAPNINTDFCDDKVFNVILKSSDGTQISELSNFKCVNVNDLSLINVNETVFKLEFTLGDGIINKQNLPYESAQTTMSSSLHSYIENYRKLKRFVEVVEE